MKIKPPRDDHQLHSSSLERERLHRNILSLVSHDLKTPLACIIGSLQIHERTKDKLSPDKKNILINTALEEAYRLDNFVTNILDMAKFESNAVTLKKELYSMEWLMEDCLILLGHRLRECDVHVRAIPAAFPITTDSTLLIRAMGILLDNAAKFSSLHPVITVEYEKIGKQVLIRIEDNGPGIPESQQAEIFSKYTQFITPNHHPIGTGLGLPICWEIMRLLDGTVSVANRADSKGAVFTLSFAG